MKIPAFIRTLGLATTLVAATPVLADGLHLRVVAIPYDDCLSIVDEATEDMDEPVILVDGAGERTVRVDVADGFVTISCRRSDNRMVVSGTVMHSTAGQTASR
jgi:hypothetical protein